MRLITVILVFNGATSVFVSTPILSAILCFRDYSHLKSTKTVLEDFPTSVFSGYTFSSVTNPVIWIGLDVCIVVQQRYFSQTPAVPPQRVPTLSTSRPNI